MSYAYKIIENNADPNLAVVEKSGISVQFTAKEIKENLAHVRKQKREIEGTCRVAEATKVNIKRTHPHIAAMSEEDLVAAYLYRQAIGTVTQALEKLTEIDDVIKQDEKSLAEMIEQTGLQVAEEAPNE